jgi:uncharacterized protein (UPF0305 family)
MRYGFDSPELKKGRRLLNTSQLVKDLQHRLSSLLKDKEFAKARQDRAAQKTGIIEDALIAHNMAVSEELMYLDPSSIIGEVKENNIDEFRNRMNVYTKKNGTGNQGYDNYIAIVSEYLAFVVREPLHPPEVRHLESDSPKDSGHRKYCAWKSRHMKDSLSLCRFCNCLPWPAVSGENYD